MGMQSFNAYHSYLESMELLSDAERGRLFTALLEYSMTGIKPELRGNEKYVFPSMRCQIDRDRAAYDSKCSKNTQNGRRGGRPRTVQASPSGRDNHSRESKLDIDQLKRSIDKI